MLWHVCICYRKCRLRRQGTPPIFLDSTICRSPNCLFVCANTAHGGNLRMLGCAQGCARMQLKNCAEGLTYGTEYILCKYVCVHIYSYAL